MKLVPIAITVAQVVASLTPVAALFPLPAAPASRIPPLNLIRAIRVGPHQGNGIAPSSAGLDTRRNHLCLLNDGTYNLTIVDIRSHQIVAVSPYLFKWDTNNRRVYLAYDSKADLIVVAGHDNTQNFDSYVVTLSPVSAQMVKRKELAHTPITAACDDTAAGELLVGEMTSDSDHLWRAGALNINTLGARQTYVLGGDTTQMFVDTRGHYLVTNEGLADRDSNFDPAVDDGRGILCVRSAVSGKLIARSDKLSSPTILGVDNARRSVIVAFTDSDHDWRIAALRLKSLTPIWSGTGEGDELLFDGRDRRVFAFGNRLQMLKLDDPSLWLQVRAPDSISLGEPLVAISQDGNDLFQVRENSVDDVRLQDGRCAWSLVIGVSLGNLYPDPGTKSVFADATFEDCKIGQLGRSGFKLISRVPRPFSGAACVDGEKRCIYMLQGGSLQDAEIYVWDFQGREVRREQPDGLVRGITLGPRPGTTLRLMSQSGDVEHIDYWIDEYLSGRKIRAIPLRHGAYPAEALVIPGTGTIYVRYERGEYNGPEPSGSGEVLLRVG
ncbi:MAG TPA: hypothetical protein VGS41_08500, partial [Chthonomonadales bacterium]|nr:hypothetical protein [Chthonomonadales bacterium]